MDEKAPLLPEPTPPTRTRSRRTKSFLAWILPNIALVYLYLHYFHRIHNSTVVKDDACPQVSTLVPSANAELWTNLTALYTSDAFKEKAIGKLSGAVRIQTETSDDMGPVGDDERWETRDPFIDWLLEAFPNVHATLKLTKVNTYGLLYEWPGSDASLKPLLMMAHYDVVPVNPDTVSDWEHPPYSGHFDGSRIWGRGSSDDKSGFTAILNTIETLIEEGFQPTRPIVLSFGFDEEAGGRHGAQYLAGSLLDSYGEDSFAMIIDEGSGYVQQYGAVFAQPGIAEKGSMNVELEIHTAGGHSSIPPPTRIGMLAAMIAHLEAHPYTPRLARGTPPYLSLQCAAAHAPDMPAGLRSALVKGRASDKQLRRAEEVVVKDKVMRALVGTTQAVDIIKGGVKSNALPEQAIATINHRIATDSSMNATKARYAPLLADLVASFNLSFSAFGEGVSPAGPSAGSAVLSAPYGLEPAPVTPTDLNGDGAPYALLSGTIKATYAKAREGTAMDAELFVAPGIMSGNTDTKYFWKLSRHIFRYNHHDMGTGGVGNIHTVNESMAASSYFEQIVFFTTLVLNMDEAKI